MSLQPKPVPPGFSATSIPAQHRATRCFKVRHSSPFRGELLDAVVREVGVIRFDERLLELEYDLSVVCGDHTSRIGFWGECPIQFNLLRRSESPVDDEYLVAWAAREGKSVAEIRRSLEVVTDRLNHFVNVERGYLGWLTTDRLFRQEQQAIFVNWAERVAKTGVPIMGPVMTDVKEVPSSKEATEGIAEFLEAFEAFFIRWRLQGMSAPYAPRPLAPHFPVMDLRPVLGHMQHGGTTFYMPDIFPVPSRDELRAIIEDALRVDSGPQHLAAWFDIVRSDNASRNQIPRLARVFEIQHYMRALYGRHAAAFNRNKGVIVMALAGFLGVSDDTVSNDLDFIAGRLAKNNWFLAPA